MSPGLWGRELMIWPRWRRRSYHRPSGPLRDPAPSHLRSREGSVIRSGSRPHRRDERRPTSFPGEPLLDALPAGIQVGPCASTEAEPPTTQGRTVAPPMEAPFRGIEGPRFRTPSLAHVRRHADGANIGMCQFCHCAAGTKRQPIASRTMTGLALLGEVVAPPAASTEREAAEANSQEGQDG